MTDGTIQHSSAKKKKKKINPNQYLKPSTKPNSKQIITLNLKCKTLPFSEENIEYRPMWSWVKQWVL